RALLVSYASTLDGRDFAAFEQLWATDAEFIGGANDRAKGPAAIRDLLQGLLKVNAAPVPGRDFHLVMNQTVDVTGDTPTRFSRGDGGRHGSGKEAGGPDHRQLLQSIRPGGRPLEIQAPPDRRDASCDSCHRRPGGDPPGAARSRRSADARRRPSPGGEAVLD